MAGGTKRMSAEEKRRAILDIYHKSKSVFTEKEILTLASKAGVNANTVADVNQALVDDCLVDKEKIGGSNYFWSFPAKKDRIMQLQHQKTLEEIEKLKIQAAEASVALQDAKRGREDDERTTSTEESSSLKKDEGDEPSTKQPKTMSRAAKLQRLNEIATERLAIEKELESLKENDPLALANLGKEFQLVLQGANRWTDNIFICKSYLTKKRGMESKQACKMLDITSSFDYPVDTVPAAKKTV